MLLGKLAYQPNKQLCTTLNSIVAISTFFFELVSEYYICINQIYCSKFHKVKEAFFWRFQGVVNEMKLQISQGRWYWRLFIAWVLICIFYNFWYCQGYCL